MDYFTRQHNVPVSDLPAKVYRSAKTKTEPIRYLVDKFPLFLSPTAVVHFTFVSAGQASRLDEFRTHLRLYGGLFRHVGEVRIVFIHQDPFHRLEFLSYQIAIDPRTFMVTNTTAKGDKPAESCFHPSRHGLCHQATGTIDRASDP